MLAKYLLVKHTPNGRKYPYLDCWGLILEYYRCELGIELPKFCDLEQSTMTLGANKLVDNVHCFVEVAEPQNNDVVTFYRNNLLYHVGIYIDGKLLHTTDNKNARLEPIRQFHNIRFFRYVNR